MVEGGPSATFAFAVEELWSMGPTNSRGPRCLPLRLPCVLPLMLLPSCGGGAEVFWKNFFFFRGWFWCCWGGLWCCCGGWGGACAWGWACGVGCCIWGCWACGAPCWLGLFLRRRRRRRCPCDGI